MEPVNLQIENTITVIILKAKVEIIPFGSV